MDNLIIPKDYHSELNLHDTQIAIKTVKDFFQGLLALRLNLSRVSAPLFVDPLSGLNDNLNGVERPVTFDIKEQNGRTAEVVQSLAKWKRYALKKYGFSYGEGLYTDMNAIRRDEITDNIHSIFVDQWDWEKVIKQEERTLVNAIKLGGEEEITKVINEMFSRFESQLIPVAQVQVYLVELVTSLLRVVRTYELNTDEIFGEEFNYFTTIFSHSPSKIRQWLTESCIRISAQVKRERLDSTKLLARNAKQYIEEHYMDPEISVEKLCAVLHVSPAYFSTVFKRETEMSFVSYLTEVRLQNALNLLNTTDDKTYVIAGKVGYTEPNYFSYVFKKRFGVSPSKYRQSAPPVREDVDKGRLE